MTYKITRVAVSDTKKDTGQKFVDKNGKPFWRVGIQTEQTGDVWHSTICYDPKDSAMNLEQGQEVELVLEKNGDFNNFKMPSKLQLLEKRVEVLEGLAGIKKESAGENRNDFSSSFDKPEEDINPDDIPF